MNKSLSVGAVSYLNTRPLLFGVKQSGLMDRITLIEDQPAIIGEMLLKGSIDIGLIPVALIPQLKEFHIITDYCIGTEGEVASVALFSEVPIEEVDTLLLDYQSRTSVNLAKILVNAYPEFELEVIVNATNVNPDYLKSTITRNSPNIDKLKKLNW
ncbi:MAG: hypothetical protein EAZ12_04250, partial [Sphingobacteriia bacterium]